ncbi:NTP transferase domain-containing protein [Magnetovibrio blakemorei]|uniref:NTP transferase domain-containing protein n=1 Tax=Magnetovibrio blakemorei TaxID=28181 RepID=UPI00147C4830|nr:NTP transferase domain-containing protein [Magnetovibrio blakemorei]
MIILAGGLSTRMGEASEYIPKALSTIGSQRAIDLLISKFLLVSHKLVVGTAWHSDLLESYISGRYPTQRISFSRESPNDLKNNATSLLYALDHIDSRYGTIISFCDLILLSNPVISGSTLYTTHKNTKGVLGTYRHSVQAEDGIVKKIQEISPPQHIDTIDNGVIGQFVFSNTLLLKEIAYSLARKGELSDITSDIITRYVAEEKTRVVEVDALLEFGTKEDLNKARKFWENH